MTVRLVRLDTFFHHVFGILGWCCEGLCCERGCEEGATYPGIDAWRDQRIGEACGVSDCEPSLTSNDGTFVRQPRSHKVCLFSVIPGEYLVAVAHQTVQSWIVLLEIIEFSLGFIVTISLEIVRKLVVISDSPANQGYEFVWTVEHPGELSRAWEIVRSDIPFSSIDHECDEIHEVP